MSKPSHNEMLNLFLEIEIRPMLEKYLYNLNSLDNSEYVKLFELFMRKRCNDLEQSDLEFMKYWTAGWFYYENLGIQN